MCRKGIKFSSLQKLIACQSAVVIIWVMFAQDLRTLGYIIMAADEVENENQTHIPNTTSCLRNRLAQVFILQNPNASRVCSPMGAVIALGKLIPGASGNALKELQTAIGVQDQLRFENYFKLLLEYLGNVTEIKITFLPEIYVSNMFSLKPAYITQINNIFKTEVSTFDYLNIVATVKKINNWVKNESGGQIPRVINTLNSTSDIVIICAVCVKGLWERNFTKVVTWLFRNPSVSIEVRMMIKTDILKITYSSTLNAKMLELPYLGKKLKMIIVLPNEVNGLTDLLHIIDEDPFTFDNELEELDNSFPMLVTLFLPKFKISTESDIKPLLRLLGINLIFNKSVGLPDMVNEASVYVDTVLQHIILEVNQIFPRTAYVNNKSDIYDPRQLSFIADHPFMFLIRLEDETILAGNYNGERAYVASGANIENVL